MKVTQKKKEGLSIEFNVVVPSDIVQKHIDTRLEEMGKTAKIPGFRPGKIPANVLKQRYGDHARAESLERVVNSSVMEVIKDKDIKPAMQPKVEIVRFDDNNEVEFSMSVEQMPEFTVADLKKIKVQKLVKKVDDKEIDDALGRIADTNKNSEVVEEKRATKKGDIVKIDFDGSVDGEKKPGMKGDDYELELGSNSFIDNFEDQLTGKNVGDHVSVKVTFPKEYGATDLAGKAAVFEVDIKEIRKAVKPKIDDEFAKAMGFDSLDKLKENIKTQIGREYEQFTRMKVKRELLDALDKANKFEVPAGMVEEEYNQIWQQHINDIKQRKLDIAEAEKDEDTKKEFRKIAERRVRLGLVLSQVGNDNNVQVKREELSQAIMREASRYPGQQQQVFEYYQKNPQAVEMLRAPLFEEKVVDFILGEANVTEKEVDLDTLIADPDAHDHECGPDCDHDHGKKSSKAKSQEKTASKSKETKSTAKKTTKK